MPRQPVKEVPRWRRGREPDPLLFAGRLSGRDADKIARAYARIAPPQASGASSEVNDQLARTGAWRWRRHMAPFIWLACLLAAAYGLRRTAHPFAYALAASLVVPLLMAWGASHLSPYARYTAAAWGLIASAWLPSLASLGFTAPLPGLLALNWAVCAALWVRHYRWRPDAPEEEAVPDSSDTVTWDRLTHRRKWHGTLGRPEPIPGGGRKYQISLDGVETHIGQLLSEPRAIAAAWGKAQTEAYVEPHPTGIESRGLLTILDGGTLETIRPWDGHGFTADGFGRVGWFADSQPTRIRAWVPRDGTRHGLIAGTTGAGKSVLLDLLVWLAITSPVPVIPVILDPQNGQSLPQWRGKVPYAAGLDECFDMLAGLYAGMLGRSRELAGMTWTDEDGYEQQGFEFFDPAMTGLPIVMPIIDEAPMILRGGGNAKRAAQATFLVGEIAKLARKTGLSAWLVAQVPSLSELMDQTLRSMLAGGNVVCLRTGDRVSAGMLGIDVDPSALPKYFPSGEPTGGLGYTVSVDNRQAPMRVSPVPAAMRRKIPQVALFDDLFESQFLGGKHYWQALNADQAPNSPDAPAPADDAPEGRRCIDAVWLVLSERAAEMERGEIIKWVSELVTGAWGREKPFTIRSITSALTTLTAGDGGRVVIKVRDGVYRAEARSTAP